MNEKLAPVFAIIAIGIVLILIQLIRIDNFKTEAVKRGYAYWDRGSNNSVTFKWKD